MTPEFSALLVDIDGTIRTQEGIPASVLEGFRHIQEQGVTTTVLTGRGFARFAEVISPHQDTVISGRTPVALENGSRIASKTGTENLKYYPLSQQEIDYVLMHLHGGDFRFIAYYPERVADKAVIWSSDKTIRAELKTKYAHFAEIPDMSLRALGKRMITDKPCMFSLSLHDSSVLQEINQKFTGDLVNASTNEGFLMVNAEGRNKGSGVLDVSDMLDIPLNQIAVAGNDQNDVEMLSLSDVYKIVVGDSLRGIITVPESQHFATPADFGRSLTNISL